MTKQSKYINSVLKSMDVPAFKASLLDVHIPVIINNVEILEQVVEEMYEKGNVEPLDNLLKLADLVENALDVVKEKRRYKGWYRFIRDVEVQVDFYDYRDKLIEAESKLVVYKKGSYIQDLNPYFSIWDNMYGTTIHIKKEDLEKVDYDPTDSLTTYIYKVT